MPSWLWRRIGKSFKALHRAAGGARWSEGSERLFRNYLQRLEVAVSSAARSTPATIVRSVQDFRS